ncbi:hypothetical protein KEM54_006815 [Ascosphaera aggregata]|nr:hypothetical protein KEM54_006815 [Ascosphaera aggregata]
MDGSEVTRDYEAKNSKRPQSIMALSLAAQIDSAFSLDGSSDIDSLARSVSSKPKNFMSWKLVSAKPKNAYGTHPRSPVQGQTGSSTSSRAPSNTPSMQQMNQAYQYGTASQTQRYAGGAAGYGQQQAYPYRTASGR